MSRIKWFFPRLVEFNVKEFIRIALSLSIIQNCFCPYIIRFITLILFTLPSAKPLLYEYMIPFFTAVKSFFMPFINV